MVWFGFMAYQPSSAVFYQIFTIRLLGVIYVLYITPSNSLEAGVLPLSREAVGVFHSPSRLGNEIFKQIWNFTAVSLVAQEAHPIILEIYWNQAFQKLTWRYLLKNFCRLLVWLVGWVLRHINPCWLLNVKFCLYIY